MSTRTRGGNMREVGYTTLIGEYLPTAKNVPVKTLLPDLGFTPSGRSETQWELNMATFPGAPSQVTS